MPPATGPHRRDYDEGGGVPVRARARGREWWAFAIGPAPLGDSHCDLAVALMAAVAEPDRRGVGANPDAATIDWDALPSAARSATAHWGTARNSENRRASARIRAFARDLTSILALQPRSVAAALVGGAAAVWIVANLAASPPSFVFLLFVGVTNGAMYALVALGFTLSYTLIDLINLPHGFVFVSGAALCAYLLDALGVSEDSSFSEVALALLISFLLVMTFCGLLSAVIELVAYRPLSHAPRQSRLVTAVGVLFILDNIVLVRTGGAPITLPDLLPNGAVFIVMGVAYTWDKLIVLVSMGLVLAGLYLGLQRTKVGRSVRAVSQDSMGAQFVGINVARTATLGFFLAGALAGAGGELYALYFTTVTWDHALRLTLIAFTAVVLGGIDSLVGAVIGAMIIGLTESFVNGFTWHSPGSNWTLSVVLAIMIILLAVRPQGLLGKSQQ